MSKVGIETSNEGIVMQKIENVKVRVNENGVLVEVEAVMGAEDVDGMYITHFACVEDDGNENFRFAILATINVTSIQSEEDLYSQTGEVWAIPLVDKDSFQKARLILARMVKDNQYYQKSTYHFPDRDNEVKADKIDITEIAKELNKLLDLLREREPK